MLVNPAKHRKAAMGLTSIYLADRITAKPIKDNQVIVNDQLNSEACRRQGFHQQVVKAIRKLYNELRFEHLIRSGGSSPSKILQ